jgi:hypothetical protein
MISRIELRNFYIIIRKGSLIIKNSPASSTPSETEDNDCYGYKEFGEEEFTNLRFGDTIILIDDCYEYKTDDQFMEMIFYYMNNYQGSEVKIIMELLQENKISTSKKDEQHI